VIVTDTIPMMGLEDGGKIEQQSIAQILADAIKRITSNRSVSELFAPDDIILEESAQAPALAPAAVV
jgi:hypothetical protein